ncbi:MAG TPA: FAD:protein FMN transferase [Tepidisphaeraceae bacterium]|nr:FAD:protein FMN transferase [Tepidisphaeraceae bacterium]
MLSSAVGQWWKAGLALVVMGAVAAIVYGLLRPARPVPTATFTGQTMGTQYAITVVGQLAAADPEALHRAAREQLEKVNALMSTYRDDSEVSRLNAATHTDWMAVSRETAQVMQLAIEVGQVSGGGYDITVGPLVNLWGFGPDKRPIKAPTPEVIEQAKQRVGLGLLEVRLDPPAVRKKRPDVYVDLSSVAKGYGVDQAAEALERAGVKDYCVEVGGEILAKGHNARGTPWQIGVESPLAEERSIERVMPLSNMAIATSGDYRNYVEEDGIRFCHIIDPKTGYPIRHKLASVSVLDPSCARADAWATALLVAGPEAGYELAMRAKLPVLLIIKTDEGFVEKWTPGFAPYLGRGE